jgi:hypothetical protein
LIELGVDFLQHGRKRLRGGHVRALALVMFRARSSLAR